MRTVLESGTIARIDIYTHADVGQKLPTSHDTLGTLNSWKTQSVYHSFARLRVSLVFRPKQGILIGRHRRLKTGCCCIAPQNLRYQVSSRFSRTGTSWLQDANRMIMQISLIEAVLLIVVVLLSEHMVREVVRVILSRRKSKASAMTWLVVPHNYTVFQNRSLQNLEMFLELEVGPVLGRGSYGKVSRGIRTV